MGTSDKMSSHLARATRLVGPVQAALAKNLLHDKSPCADFYDLDALRTRFNEVNTALPNWNHAVAIKTNPIAGVLLEAKRAGLGAEAASMGEMEHALSLGFDPAKIVYDSPVKTAGDLERAIKAGVHINLDNLDEVNKVNQVLSTSCKGVAVGGRIGIRVNPEVGAGKIAMSSTAGRSSKFGLMCRGEFEEPVLKLFAEKINKQAGFKQVKFIDVGGGIPTDYHSDDEKVNFAEYAELLAAKVPTATDYHLIIEFGRSLFTKYAFSISRVETVKDWGDRITALTHFGSNQFLREVYLPDVWFHRISVMDAEGNPKMTEEVEQDVGGPLCFQGDFIAKGRPLPAMESGDHLIMHDTGGYTYSLHARFNSIQAPAIYGYERTADEKFKFVEFKSREELSETLKFWGTHEPREI